MLGSVPPCYPMAPLNYGVWQLTDCVDVKIIKTHLFTPIAQCQSTTHLRVETEVRFLVGVPICLYRLPARTDDSQSSKQGAAPCRDANIVALSSNSKTLAFEAINHGANP